jgi:hypothetical protein
MAVVSAPFEHCLKSSATRLGQVFRFSVVAAVTMRWRIGTFGRIHDQ